MSKKRIVFLPYKLHQQHIIEFLAQKMPVTTMLPPEKILPQNTSIEGVRIKYKQFGMDLLKKIIKTEVRTLKYVEGLSKILNQINIDSLISYEMYHWYSFQSIFYKKRNPEIKLFFISEMKMWPKNFVARISKKILLSFFKLNLKHVDGIFVYTQSAYDFTKKYIPKANVILLPTPIETEIFKPSSDREFFQDNTIKLLMNARFSPYKRYDDLFDAISLLIKKGRRIQLTCISRYAHDKKDIEKLIRAKGLEEFVHVVNPASSKKDLVDLYQSNDVLVLPSHNEAIGLVVPEAMACGTPTITSDTVGANTYVQNGETGLIFKTGDVEELATCIEKCGDADVLKRFSENAMQCIQEKFTPDAYMKSFNEAIKRNV